MRLPPVLTFNGKAAPVLLIGVCSLFVTRTASVAAVPILENAPPASPNAADGKQRKAGSVGNARGYVVDAATGAFIKDAKVELVLPSDTEPVRDSNASTTSEGYFQFRAPLGRISSRFDAGRFLMSSPLAVLGGSARHVEKFVGVTQLSLRISHPGYKPFYGVVGVEKANGTDFSVWLQPVALAPEATPYTSYADMQPHLGRIRDVTLSTVTPQPGEDVTFSFHTTALPSLPGKKPRFRTSVEDPETSFFMGDSGKSDKPSGDPISSEVLWQGKLHVNGKKKPGVRLILFDYDTWDFHYRSSFRRWIAVGADTATRSAVAPLMQQLNEIEAAFDGGTIPDRDTQMALREQILAVWPGSDPNAAVHQLERNHQYSDALATLRQAKINDSLREADLLLAQGQYSSAVKVLKENKEYRFGIYQCAQFAEAVERKPGDLAARVALANLASALTPRQGNRESGAAANEAKAKLWKLAIDNPPTPRNTEEQILLSRLLLAQGKFLEAIAAVKNAESDVKFSAAARLQHAAILSASGDFDSAFPLYDGVIGDGSQIKDFYARHNFALILLRKGQFDRAASLLAMNVDSAHGTKSNDTGFSSTIFYGNRAYTLLNGPSRSSIVGYSYPEAANEALLLQTMGSNEDPATDWLQTTIHCRALVESGLNKEAFALLQRLMVKMPSVSTEPQVMIAQALAQIGAADREGAWATTKQLRAVSSHDPEVKILVASLSDQQIAEAEAAEAHAKVIADQASLANAKATTPAKPHAVSAHGPAAKKPVAAKKTGPVKKVRTKTKAR